MGRMVHSNSWYCLAGPTTLPTAFASPRVGRGISCWPCETWIDKSGRVSRANHNAAPRQDFSEVTSSSFTSMVIGSFVLSLGFCIFSKNSRWLTEMLPDSCCCNIDPQRVPRPSCHFLNGKVLLNSCNFCSNNGPSPPMTTSSTCTPITAFSCSPCQRKKTHGSSFDCNQPCSWQYVGICWTNSVESH